MVVFGEFVGGVVVVGGVILWLVGCWYYVFCFGLLFFVVVDIILFD